jgi:uncharacterized delta-60 repeat protein/uncharacterized repeat protein (TIGR01451 family)
MQRAYEKEPRRFATRVRNFVLMAAVLSMLFLWMPMRRAFARAGDLDPAFGSAGIVTTDFGLDLDERGEAIAIQGDGRIVVAGSIRSANAGLDIGLARYNADGSLDSTFGTGGLVRADFGGSEQVFDLAILPDGRIVTAGIFAGANPQGFLAARFNTDGSLDASFGTGGKTVIAFALPAQANAIAIQSDSKIVLAGKSDLFGFLSDFALARLNSDGTLDTGFGTGGKVQTDFGLTTDEAFDLVIQSDGRIVVGGRGAADTPLGPVPGFALVRYTANGQLDPSFGPNGQVVTFVGRTFSETHALALQSDGRIVAAGIADDSSATTVVGALARYDSETGALDLTFGSNGTVLTPTVIPGGPLQLNDLAIQSNSRIVVAGGADLDSTSLVVNNPVVIRYGNDGVLDQEFGNNGLVVTAPGGAQAEFQALAIQNDGKIVAAGFNGLASASDFLVARYDAANRTDLSIAVTDTPDPQIPGQMINYTITVTNNGPEPAADLAIETATPLNTSFQSAAAPVGSITAPAAGGTGQIIFRPGSDFVLLPGFAVPLTVAVRINEGAVVGTVISASASVTSEADDPNPANNSATATTAVNSSLACVQEGAKLLTFNTANGDYTFRDCSKGFTLTGRGKISTNGCKIQLVDGGPDAKRPDRNVAALVNPCTRAGNATIQVFASSKSFSISDTDITNNACACP